MGDGALGLVGFRPWVSMCFVSESCAVCRVAVVCAVECCDTVCAQLCLPFVYESEHFTRLRCELHFLLLCRTYCVGLYDDDLICFEIHAIIFVPWPMGHASRLEVEYQGL